MKGDNQRTLAQFTVGPSVAQYTISVPPCGMPWMCGAAPALSVVVLGMHSRLWHTAASDWQVKLGRVVSNANRYPI